MLNNKGQSLVAFVLLLPIFIFILILVIDVSNLILERRELDNINYIAIEYALKNNDYSYDMLEDIIIKNDNDIDIENILYKDNKIYIDIKKDYNGRLINLLIKNVDYVESSFVGYIESDKKIIERNK